MSTPPPMDLCTILTESKRIVKAHSRHFLALSVLFLLPLSFSVVVFPTLQQLLVESAKNDIVVKTLLRTSHDSSPDPAFDKRSLVLAIGYSIFVFVYSLCAVGSITYSVFHGFFGRPVKLVSALKSILYSFLPLMVTTLVCQVIVSGVAAVLAGLFFLILQVFELTGFGRFDYASPSFMPIALVFVIVLMLVVVYLQVKWALVSVIAVAESSWGIKPLKRSAHLVEGHRWLAFSLYLYYSFLAGVLVWSSSQTATYLGESDWWKSWVSVLQIVFTSAVLTLLYLYQAAATTVLYMYCKATHGELAMEIAEEFTGVYVSLPFDDGKVPHLVSVVYNS